MKKYIGILLTIAAFVFSLTGCGGDEEDFSEQAQLSHTALSIQMGETAELSVLNYAGDVKWSSNEEAICVVSEQGVVEAISIGSSAITATLDDGDLKTCIVSVQPGSSQIQSMKLTSLYSDANDITVNYTDSNSVLLKAVCVPDVPEKLVWSSSDERIAQVDANGNVTVYGNGIVTIKAMALNGVEATCTVRVKNAPANLVAPVVDAAVDEVEIPVIDTGKTEGKFTSRVPVSSPSAKTSVIVSDKNVYLNVAESFKLTYAVGNTTMDDVTWSSSDKTVAIVDGGRIVGIGEGRCTISAVTGDGAVASCEVAVGEAEIKKMKKEVSDSKKD